MGDESNQVGQVILDSSGSYRPIPDYKVISSDLEVLTLTVTGMTRVWARGRITGAVERLAREWGIDATALRAPDAWLEELEVPVPVLDQHASSLRRALTESPPFSRGEAVARILDWVTGHHNQVARLLSEPDALAEALAFGLQGAPKALLRWLATTRTDLPQAALVTDILASDDPLGRWFGLDGDSDWVARAQEFLPAAPPPSARERFGQFWHLALAQGEFSQAAKVCRSKLPRFAREVIRAEALVVYRARTPVEQVALDSPCREIFGDQWARVGAKGDVKLTPLPEDASVDDCLNWFRSYRDRIDWKDRISLHRLEAARSFSKWFLAPERFPKWCAEGERGELCFRVSTIIRDAVKATNVVLVVIVDGLGELEHRLLVGEITKDTSRVRLSKTEAIFSTLPTITDVCKGSMLSGRPQREWKTPNYTEMVQSCARQGSRSYYLGSFRVEEVVRRMTNSETSLVVVNYTGLDSDLHAASDAGNAGANVKSHIAFLTDAVGRVIDDVSAEIENFAVIFCSDHGQVVGACSGSRPRTEAVKQRLRIAEGERLQHEVLLSSDMTMCEKSYFAIEDGSAWSTEQENLFGCHGGVFPEEVITRVSVLRPTGSAVELKISATGQGVAGVSGTLGWQVVNLSDVDVSIIRVGLRHGQYTTALQPPIRSVRPHSSWDVDEMKVDTWPTETDSAGAKLEVEFAVSGTDELHLAGGPADLTTEAGYSSDPLSLD